MLRFHPEAEAEALAAVQWYELRDQDAATHFRDGLADALSEVEQHPHRWARYLHGTRIYLIDRFPYAVVYLQQSPLVVVAVALLHRDPGYWKIRLTNE